MPRALIAFVCLFALGLPALGQTGAPTKLFGEMSDAEQAKRIEELIEQLGDEDWEILMEAAKALGEIGPKAAPAVPVLIRFWGEQTWPAGPSRHDREP